MNRHIICISCPMGCRLTIEGSPQKMLVNGNKCSRGEVYAREEVLAPKRVVTATVSLSGNENALRVPVKSTGPIPKEMIANLLNQLYKIKLSSPVEAESIVLENYNNTGENILVIRTL